MTRVLGEGLAFPEGPSVLDGRGVAVAAMRGEGVSLVAPDGTVSLLAHTGGAPNGTCVGADGSVYVANNGGLSATADGGYWHSPTPRPGGVQRIRPDGTVETVVDDLPGPGPRRPNDLCLGPDGLLYVTDSANWDDLRAINPGAVLRVDPATGALEVLAELPAMPNGIAFGPDATTLYVSQSLTRRVLRADVRDGAVGEFTEFCRLPKGSSPDGFCLDTRGNLYVCGSYGHEVFVHGPDGALKESFPTGPGTQPTNCLLRDGELVVTMALAGTLVGYPRAADPLPLFT